MPLAHILAPQLIKRAQEIEQHIGRPAGYLTAPPAEAAGASEAEARAQIDREQQAAGAADEAKTKMREAIAPRVKKKGNEARSVAEGLDSIRRIEALAGKKDITAADLKGMSDREIEMLRAKRRQLMAQAESPPTGTTIYPNSYLGVQGHLADKNRKAERFTPELRSGERLGDLLGMQNDAVQRGPAAVVAPYNPAQFHKNEFLNMTGPEAVQYSANRLRYLATGAPGA